MANKTLLETYITMYGDPEKFPNGDVREVIKSLRYDERFIDWFEEVYGPSYYGPGVKLQLWWDKAMQRAGRNVYSSKDSEAYQYKLRYGLQGLGELYRFYKKDIKWLKERMQKERLQKRINKASKEVGVDLDI